MQTILQYAVVLLALVSGVHAQTDEANVRRAVNDVLAALGAHDGAALYQLFLPEASITAVMPDGAVRTLTADEFIKRNASSKEAIRERIWNLQVSVDSDVATVVAPYDFFREGKRSHCGVNAFTLAKSAAGWRVGGIFFTMRQTGCSDGPPDSRNARP